MPTTFNSPPLSVVPAGLYLNTDYRFNCNGSLTAWNLCYYLTDRQSPTQIKTGIWRRRENGELFELVNESTTTLNITNPGDGTKFLCRRWNLNESWFVNVQEGDIIGVYIEDTLSIHLFESNPNSNSNNREIMKVDNANDILSNVSSSMMRGVPYFLYVEAVIGNFVCTNFILYELTQRKKHYW